jgi:hypothetical protein
MGRKLRMLGVCHYSLEDVVLAEKINRCYYKEVSVVFADARPDGFEPCRKSIRCGAQWDAGRS